MRKIRVSQCTPDPIEVRKLMIEKGIKPGEVQRALKRKRTSVWYALHGYRPGLLLKIARYVGDRK